MINAMLENFDKRASPKKILAIIKLSQVLFFKNLPQKYTVAKKNKANPKSVLANLACAIKLGQKAVNIKAIIPAEIPKSFFAQ